MSGAARGMRFRALGPLEIAGGGEDRTPSAPKLRSLLALLLLQRGQVVPTTTIVDELWGQAPPRRALPTIQTYVSTLRKTLGPDLLHTRQGGYLLTADGADCDLREFDRLAGEGRRYLDQGDAAAASRALSEALLLWRGEPFANVPAGEILAAHVTRLQEERLEVVRLRMAADLSLGRHHRLVSELKELLCAHPLHEGFQGQLMTALHRCGRRLEALEIFQRFRAKLVAELGLEPSAELQALQRRLLAADEEETSALPPAHLPPDIADFTGRREQTSAIERWLTAPSATATRLVSILGMVGIGKTTLAVHAAHRLKSRFPDGQLLADLRGSGPDPADPGEVLARLLQSLGTPADRIPRDLVERRDLFRTRTASSALLLILDDAAGPAQVTPLLPGGDRCGVIVTSRASWVAAGRTLLLEPPPAAECVELLKGIAGRDRVAAEPAAARDIARACGGLPLAIRVAGTRLAYNPRLPLRRLAERLEDPRQCLDELRVGDIDLRRDLAAVYRDLQPEDEAVLRAAGRMPAGRFTAASLAAVLGADRRHVELSLARLTERHLLSSGWNEAFQGPTYALPELLRVHACRPADPGPADSRTRTGRLRGRPAPRSPWAPTPVLARPRPP